LKIYPSFGDLPASDGRRSTGMAIMHHMFELREEALPYGLADFSRTWTSAIDFFSKIALYYREMSTEIFLDLG
jgi:hypothetical protein